MPPLRWLKRPACANPQAMAMDPSAVTTHDRREIAPTLAMFVGSMMIAEPIMFTATMNVSWTRLIFLASCMVVPFSEGYPDCLLPDHVGVELDAAIHAADDRDHLERPMERARDRHGLHH